MTWIRYSKHSAAGVAKPGNTCDLTRRRPVKTRRRPRGACRLTTSTRRRVASTSQHSFTPYVRYQPSLVVRSRRAVFAERTSTTRSGAPQIRSRAISRRSAAMDRHTGANPHGSCRPWASARLDHLVRFTVDGLTSPDLRRRRCQRRNASSSLDLPTIPKRVTRERVAPDGAAPAARRAVSRDTRFSARGPLGLSGARTRALSLGFVRLRWPSVRATS